MAADSFSALRAWRAALRSARSFAVIFGLAIDSVGCTLPGDFESPIIAVEASPLDVLALPDPPVAGALPMVVPLLIVAVAAVPLGTIAPGLPPVAGALPRVLALVLAAAVALVAASTLPVAPAPWA